jgi:hypothetical protein
MSRLRLAMSGCNFEVKPDRSSSKSHGSHIKRNAPCRNIPVAAKFIFDEAIDAYRVGGVFDSMSCRSAA